MKILIRTWFFRVLVLMLAVGPSLAFAAVQLQLDRNRVTAGETVTLTFQTDNPRQSLDADFSALAPDFEILDRRSETQLSIVNGRQTAVVRLLLTVEPQRSGELQIPPIDFGGERTEAATLRVDPAPELAPGDLPPVFIEVEVVPEKGPYYVHAQLGLVVRVFYQQNLTEAAISQPEPSPGSVRLLQETPYQADRGGERYRVLERRYAIFPERSGELTLPPMQLSGRLVERRDSSIWQPTVRGRRISVESEALTLQIEPRPASFGGAHWQPARDYAVTQQVSSSDALRVGEPVTRTIIIDAVGLEENMIVEPEWPELPGARVYPDQPQGISRDNGEWVLGHKEFRYAVVPEQEGELVLPELTVHWWDTVNDRERTAVLPAKTLQVLPSALVPTAVPPPAAAAAAPATAPLAVPAAGGSPFWRWLTLLFAVLWLATLGLLFLWRRPAPPPSRPTSLPAADQAECLDRLRRACEQGDAAGARRELATWARRYARQGRSLLELAADCGDTELREGIYALDGAGFRPAAEGSQPGWDGRGFWRRFSQWRDGLEERSGQAAADPLDLYAPANRMR